MLFRSADEIVAAVARRKPLHADVADAIVASLDIPAISALQAWASSGSGFRLAIPLIALWGVQSPAVQGLMARQVGASEQGQLQGALQSLRGLCELGTPLLYTQVFARFSDPASAALLIPGAPYWLAAVLVGAALAVSVAAPATRPA